MIKYHLFNEETAFEGQRAQGHWYRSGLVTNNAIMKLHLYYLWSGVDLLVAEHVIRSLYERWLAATWGEACSAFFTERSMYFPDCLHQFFPLPVFWHHCCDFSNSFFSASPSFSLPFIPPVLSRYSSFPSSWPPSFPLNVSLFLVLEVTAKGAVQARKS